MSNFKNRFASLRKQARVDLNERISKFVDELIADVIENTPISFDNATNYIRSSNNFDSQMDFATVEDTIYLKVNELIADFVANIIEKEIEDTGISFDEAKDYITQSINYDITTNNVSNLTNLENDIKSKIPELLNP